MDTFFTRKNILIGGGVLVTATVLTAWLLSGGELSDTEPESSTPVVELTTAQSYAGNTSVSLIGSVRAFSEAAVTPERAGRVTSVPVRLGQQVRAGQVIATLENASEQASVLQAEGVYEAALASAAQNNINPDEAASALKSARNSAITNLRTSYSTVGSVIRTDVDQFFSNPTGNVPGLKIDGQGYTDVVSEQRVVFQAALPAWEARINDLSIDSDLDAEIAFANDEIERAIDIISTFITIFNEQTRFNRYSEAQVSAFATSFTATRNNLIQLQSQLRSSESAIESARDAVRKANLQASGGVTSAADAQVKQALGGLRAAQANLAKTILRTPISGTINSLDVRAGDFVGAQQQIAVVANNNALEIVTSIGERERSIFAAGDQVTIEDSIEGTVTEIAPAVNPDTGKVEVRIAAESGDLQNGDTVTVTRRSTTTATSTEVFVPLSAIQFSQTDGSVLVVVDGVLEARAITRGNIRGNSVQITEGLSPTEPFVVDARGLQPGTEVEILN